MGRGKWGEECRSAFSEKLTEGKKKTKTQMLTQRKLTSHNCSLQVNLNRIRGVIGKTQCWFNAPRAGVRAWRLRGTCQRMTLTGCDDTQFVLLCLNCHLMCLQSGAVDTLVGRDLREPLKSGLTTSRTEPMTPTVSWMWPNWARKHVPLALACLSLSPVILVS